MRFAIPAFAALSVLTLASAQQQQPAAAPVIKISQVHSTTYNGSLYLVPSKPDISFSSDVTYPDQSVNSTETTPFIVGVDSESPLCSSNPSERPSSLPPPTSHVAQ